MQLRGAGPLMFQPMSTHNCDIHRLPTQSLRLIDSSIPFRIPFRPSLRTRFISHRSHPSPNCPLTLPATPWPVQYTLSLPSRSAMLKASYIQLRQGSLPPGSPPLSPRSHAQPVSWLPSMCLLFQPSSFLHPLKAGLVPKMVSADP